ncbi:MAG: hypothetical protein VB055_06325 [Oscillospiraceae bacterium]|nr:hypothetical protein [Oscillospiraceae bacterium]
MDEKEKKPIYKKWWFWVIIALLVIGVIGGSQNQGKQSDDTSQKEDTAATTPEETTNQSLAQQIETDTESTSNTTVATQAETTAPKADLSNVATEYTLSAGNYTAGIDIPAGKCNVEAVSGTGNLFSSNMFSGGVNEMFGIDDGSGTYSPSFSGLKLSDGTRITTNGLLVIKLTYTSVDSDFTGREYDDSKAIELTNGNYTAGSDFESGVYKITAVSGSGNISSDNMFDGGVNEMFGVDDGSGFYNNQILNAEFPSGCAFTISGGVTVKLVPEK